MPMTITRRSTVSGTVNTMTVNLTNQDLLRWQQGEMTLADVEPPLSAAEQRFLETGVTPGEDAALAVLDETIGTLATKKDLEALETRVATEFKHLKWMIGVNMTLTLLILGKLLLFKA